MSSLTPAAAFAWKIAAASGCPIQIGRKRFPSTVFSNTIGCLPTMSKLTP